MSEETVSSSFNVCELTAHLCRLVVKTPDKVQIKENRSEHAVIVTAQVADEDIGRVIGKQGSTIRAIRHLLDQVGRKNKMRVYFEIKNKQTAAAPPSTEGQSSSKQGATESSKPEGDSDTSDTAKSNTSGDSTSESHPA